LGPFISYEENEVLLMQILALLVSNTLCCGGFFEANTLAYYVKVWKFHKVGMTMESSLQLKPIEELVGTME
jgi:hypothetical protein